MNCVHCATPLPSDSRFCSSCGALVSDEDAKPSEPVAAEPELKEKLVEDVRGDFVIEGVLGRGGMAVVFLARDVHLDRKVAIKVLPPELTFGTGMVERFKREAKTAATLDHPHIVPIYRVSNRRLFWYVMKYVEGKPLDVVLERETRLPPARTARLLAQVAKALQFAHDHGVIHRDIKPANVMISAGDWVTVTDFGIAKAVGSESLTGSGSAIGTPYYMSPEQCAGKGKRITGAADQYSLGIVAFQMVSGRLPFTGDSVVDIIKQHCFDPVPPLAELQPGLPARLPVVVERALAKKPEERFPSVGAFADAFAEAAGGPARSPAAPIQPRVAPTVPESVAPSTPRRRAKSWIAGAAAVAVVAVGLAVWYGTAERPALGLDLAVETAAVTKPSVVAATDTAGARTPTEALRQTGPADRLSPPPRRDLPRVPRFALLILSGIPPGATVALDGRLARDSSLSLKPGDPHIVSVSLQGYEPWVDTVTPGEGDQLARFVQLRQRPQQAPPQQAPPRPTLVEAPAPAPTGGIAHLTVGSRPLAAITINGREFPINPVTNLEVPAGAVRINFRVIDETGTWSFDTTITLAPGERRNLGRIPLRQRP